MSAETVITGNSAMQDSGYGSLNGLAELTPEKLAIMRLNASEDRDVFSDPGTPSRGGKSLSFHHSATNGSRSLARTSRQISSGSRRTSSFMHSHRNKMSMELTHQAEAKFFSLIELMSSASREASSLKEYWGSLMSDRESFDREREELMMQIDEITETLEQKESQHHHHGRELGDKKKEIEKLIIELSSALNNISIHKQTIADRDRELERNRAELSDIRLSISRSQNDHEKTRSELESLVLRLTTAEGERDSAREDAERHRGSIRNLNREISEIKSRNTDLTDRLEVSRKEVTTLTERIKSWQLERDSYLVEKDRLQENLRKITLRFDETTRELSETNDRHGHLQREVRQLKESLRIAESERDDHHGTIDRLRNEIRTKTSSIEEVETRLSELLVKYESSKREVTDRDDRIRDIESEIHTLQHRIERSQEEQRTVVLERDQLRDDLDHERTKSGETQRHLAALQETLTRTEATLVEIRSEVSHTTERIKIVEHERDEARDKHGHHNNEMTQLKQKLTLLQAEVRTATEHRDRVKKDLEHFKRKYEEVTETIEEYDNGSGELECEIESLRAMLREAREQKERAISARTTADRERDEYMSKYEEKCRQLERMEESGSSFYHSSGHSHSHGHGHGHSHGHGASRSTSTRVVTRSASGFGSSSKQEDANGE